MARKTGLKANGRLKKGYRFARGGRIVKAKAAKRAPARRRRRRRYQPSTRKHRTRRLNGEIDLEVTAPDRSLGNILDHCQSAALGQERPRLGDQVRMRPLPLGRSDRRKSLAGRRSPNEMEVGWIDLERVAQAKPERVARLCLMVDTEDFEARAP